MSRYPASDYRAPRERSRSPRFSDRRPSAAALYDARPPAPTRGDSNAPRGPRSLYDTSRPAAPAPSGTAAGARPALPSLRNAPPLGSGDRDRQYRERDYERRERGLSPRERSPPRKFPDSRDLPPRDLDAARDRRLSRDGPPSAGSTFSDSPAFGSNAYRGGYARGRGRGESSLRGARGGRNPDERDLFRRERERASPPRWGRDVSRESREPERRDERRPERREEERRPPEWFDRERESDRARREPILSRLDSKPSNESMASTTASAAPPINPARLALIESTGADVTVRRSSLQKDPSPAREVRPNQTTTPSYLNGRAETAANRYGMRGSSSPTQAPPVPAFTLSFAPPAATSAPARPQPSPSQPAQVAQETKSTPSPSVAPPQPADERANVPPSDAPTAPKAAPSAPKAHRTSSPPPAAPKAPRAHEAAESAMLPRVRSYESISGSLPAPSGPAPGARVDTSLPTARPSQPAASPTTASALPTLVEPVSPRVQQGTRATDFATLPTGPRATRISPAQIAVSPRLPFASPRSDTGAFQGQAGATPSGQTPPQSAPAGPRGARSFSVSPKVTTNSIAPTAPKADRAPPIAPRGPERGLNPPTRPFDRVGAPPSWAPPSGPRGQQQWNQWRRFGAPAQSDKIVPTKRDFAGDEKSRLPEQAASSTEGEPSMAGSTAPATGSQGRSGSIMSSARQPPSRQSSLVSGHSAAQSFFGQPTKQADDPDDTAMSDAVHDPTSTSEDDESDFEEDLTLFNAKFERQRRQLEARKVDLSARQYRATTPLESIARLERIGPQDLQRINEQREHEMDVDDASVTDNHLLPTTHSSDSGDGVDLLTPKGDDDRRVSIRGSDESSEGVRRVRRPSPEPVSLPYLLKDSQRLVTDHDAFSEGFRRHDDAQSEVLDAVEDALLAEEEAEIDVEGMFVEHYRRWREECEAMDRVKEDLERLERQQSYEPGPEPEAPPVAAVNPVMEGRRLHKFNSEYEFEQVLKQSEETARIEQEKQEREAKKNQADMEKEATIPDQQTEDEVKRTAFVDSNRFRDPDSLITVFSYEPPPDTFTIEEQQIFIAAFKDTPKKWGEIASLLPGRTYKDCIHHYYANKWDGRFRDNRTKKLKGGRRGRGGKGSTRGRVGGLMADLAGADDLLSAENMSEKGRPRRAAAPTTFGEKEVESKAHLTGPSPAKKPGPTAKTEGNGEAGAEKPGKRQKRTGEKPGRKAKVNQPLAALAAAPQASPNKQFVHTVPGHEDPSRAQKLEDASLLASLHSGHARSVLTSEGHQMLYAPEQHVMHALPPPEEPERSKPPGSVSAPKSSASSYWSVPEQNDFVKYIGYFGRDFAAIAAHMGTKTQTMIKNHFQRQVDGGNRADLEEAANVADERRARGEDMGPAPIPTPIVKRKYEAPMPAVPRPLAPSTDAMEVDDAGPASRPQAQAPKHASPPQYQSQPRFSGSAHGTPIPASRVAPSPLVASAAPPASQPMPPAHQRTTQHPLGARLSFMPDARQEVRPSATPLAGFRTSQDSTPHNQPPQPLRNAGEGAGPEFFRDLERDLYQERDRAVRMQQQLTQQERIENLQRQSSIHRTPVHGSPIHRPLQNPPDRKPIMEERPPSPVRSAFPTSTLSRPLVGSSVFSSLGPTPFSSLAGRSVFNPSPPKREETRPSSVPTGPPVQLPPTPAPPSVPKKSNVMSLLNSEPEEEKPPKRESQPSAPPRLASPTSRSLSHAPNMATPRREPSFGQPSIPQSQFQRGGLGQSSTASPGPPPALKHEPSSGGAAAPMPMSSRTQDWTARLLGPTPQPSPPTLEREVRPYYQHSHRPSLLGSMGQTRANPSPPPNQGLGHSRTPSLTGQPSREPPRPALPGQQTQPQSVQPLQPNPYASHAQQFSQHGPHHSHSSSLSGPFPNLHQRAISRDDHHLRQDPYREDAASLRWRTAGQQEHADAESRRREEQFLLQQRQQQDENERRHVAALQQQQQQQPRAPPRPLQPPTVFSSAAGPPFGAAPPARGIDLRAQSRLEADMMVRQHEEQERRMQEEAGERRRQMQAREREQARQEEEFRRRQQREREDLFGRHAHGGQGQGQGPLEGAYGAPPPPRR